MSKQETKFKVGDIVETKCIYRDLGSSMHRIKLTEPIELEILGAQKTATHVASYRVKNLKTGLVESTQYWEDEIWLSRSNR